MPQFHHGRSLPLHLAHNLGDLVNHHLWGVRSDQSDQSDHCAYYLPYNPSSLQEIKVEEPLASFS